MKKIKFVMKIIITLVIVVLTLFSNKDSVMAKEYDFSKAKMEFQNLERYYEMNEIFQITIVSNTTISNYSFDNLGIQVLSSSIEYNNLIMTLIVNDEIKNSTIEFIVDEKILKIYTYKNENLIFISTQSLDDAFENYISFMYEENLITDEEFNSIRRNYYTISNNNETIVYSSSFATNTSLYIVPILPIVTTVYIRGKIEWIDDYGVSHPCQYIDVEIYTKNELGIGTVRTDSLGNFSLTYELGSNYSDESLSDIYILAYAKNSDVVLKSNYDNLYFTSSTAGGSITTIEDTKTINITLPMINDIGRAMQISQAAITASNYAKVIGDTIKLTTVNVIYPANKDNCQYSGGTIYILHDDATVNEPASYASWDVIMHEYGHHFNAKMGLCASVWGHHRSGQNMWEHYYENYYSQNSCDECTGELIYINSESKAKERGLELAWSEGLATFYSIVAQQYYKESLVNIETVGDECYTSYNGVNNGFEESNLIVTNLSKLGIDDRVTKYSSGEGNEETITNVLYNMYDQYKIGDGNDYEADICSLGHFEIWNKIISSKSVTLTEFIDYYNKINVDSDQNIINYVLTKAGVTWIPQNVFQLDNQLPTFKWKTKYDFSNNIQSKLEIADINYDIILTITDFSKDIHNDNSMYELSIDEWNSILNANGYMYNWRVVITETTTPIIGTYTSSWRQEIKPDTNNVITNGTVTEGTISSLEGYNWYKFTTIEDGIYSFYTESNIDTVGYLFNNIVYGLSTIGNIANNDDINSMDTDFKLTYTLTTNQTVYLRINSNNEIGNYNLYVQLEEHIHNYSKSYSQYDEIGHLAYCICNEYLTSEEKEETITYVIEEHTYQTYNLGYKCTKCLYYTEGPIVEENNLLNVKLKMPQNNNIISEGFLNYKKENE